MSDQPQNDPRLDQRVSDEALLDAHESSLAAIPMTRDYAFCRSDPFCPLRASSSLRAPT